MPNPDYPNLTQEQLDLIESINNKAQELTDLYDDVGTENVSQMEFPKLRLSQSVRLANKVVAEVLVPDVEDEVPFVSAGEYQEVERLDLVQLAATVRDDIGISSIQWIQLSGTAVTLDEDKSLTPTFTAPNLAGLLTFQITVTDTSAQANSDTVSILVDPANVALEMTSTLTTPAILAGNDGTVTIDTLVGDSPSVTIVWDDGEPDTIVAVTGPVLHTYANPGSYDIVVTATDVGDLPVIDNHTITVT